MNQYKIINTDAINGMKQIEEDSIHCVITSPPYFPLIRDYGIEPILWDDGWKGSLGEEPDPMLYVEHMVSVCKEIKRVLRPDGVFWLNIGDSYAKHNKWKKYGIKRKDLIGIPWRLVFRLQEIGFYLRQDNIWQKAGVNPESVADRTVRCHEYVFQLAKSDKYFFDKVNIQEEASESSIKRIKQKNFKNQKGGPKDYGTTGINASRSIRKTLENFAQNPKCNKRSVWKMSTAHYKGLHFAVMPEKVAEICLLSSTSNKGCCNKCGSPKKRHGTEIDTWIASCVCDNTEMIPCRVLDPFNGVGTTGVVASRYDRDYIGIEMNKEYISQTGRRIKDVDPLFTKESPNINWW